MNTQNTKRLNRLRQIRKEQGIKQIQLAALAGVSLGTLNKAEVWGLRVTAETEKRLARALEAVDRYKVLNTTILLSFSTLVALTVAFLLLQPSELGLKAMETFWDRVFPLLTALIGFSFGHRTK